MSNITYRCPGCLYEITDVQYQSCGFDVNCPRCRSHNIRSFTEVKSMSPWIPEKDAAILRRVGKTGEECAELLKVTNRIVIQGIDGVDPETGKSNLAALQEEMADVIAQCEINIEHFGFNMEEIRMRVYKKKAWMAEWEALVKDKQ